MSEHMKLSPKDILNLAAPHSWVASIAPVLLGFLYCQIYGLKLHIWMYPCLLLGCVLLQSAVNAFNDYMDFIKGTDTSDDFLERSEAALVCGDMSAKTALTIGLCFLACGILLGLLCCMYAGMMPVYIGLIGVIVVALYSCGPLPISYLPIGEFVSGFVMGGLIPLGVCACADGKLHMEALFASLPLILGIGLIMMSNNGCDIEKDEKAGRHTFPNCIGREKTLKAYHCLVILWLLLVAIEPVYFVGPVGIVSILFLILLARKPFMGVFSHHLLPKERIGIMKGIGAANITGNGAYCLTLLVGCIIKAIYV